MEKAKLKFIRSLEQKKYRDFHKLFIAEGDKTVREMIASSLITKCILAKKTWLEQIPENFLRNVSEIIEINDKELSQVSFLKTPNQALAIAQIPHYSLDITELTDGLSLYLDGVQDPGNMGAIIRLADWFGIRHVLCGKGCADPFSPKTVQATMGAIIRVKTYNADETFFRKLKKRQPDFPVFGTFLEGENLYNTPVSNKAVIVMGNESKGISEEVAQHINRHLFIPQYPSDGQTSESLNVATAAAIVCAEFRSRDQC